MKSKIAVLFLIVLLCLTSGCSNTSQIAEQPAPVSSSESNKAPYQSETAQATEKTEVEQPRSTEPKDDDRSTEATVGVLDSSIQTKPASEQPNSGTTPPQVSEPSKTPDESERHPEVSAPSEKEQPTPPATEGPKPAEQPQPTEPPQEEPTEPAFDIGYWIGFAKSYAKDGEKTERELFCEGIHCNPQTAREQFITVKEQFDKPDGIQAYHGYLSFEETDITPELAQQVGMAFAERMWGDRFQVLVTTHLNTEHLHCHFVVNSVSFRDGKRLQNKEKAWWYFRHIADEVCLEHGLSVVQNPEAYQSPRILTQKDKAGMPTRYNLARTALDEAIAMSHNLRQLEYHLSEMGYTLGSNPKRKYWTIKGKGDERPIRLHRLGEEYTKERITQRLIENRDNIDFEPFQPKTYRPKQYRLRTRSDRIGKVGGLYGLYLYYCYRLGYLPKYKVGQQNHARVHYLFKEDLMKIDELTKQVTLLGKHHIGTDEQLFSYQHSVEEQIKTITADRTHLRNEIRKVNITDAELSQAKASISLLTEKLKELRKEVKLCQDIAARSKVIEEKVDAVRVEEEKSKRKENRNYEQRR